MILGIYGAGGLGREVYELAVRVNEKSKSFEHIFFVDDSSQQKSIFGVRVMSLAEFKECPETCITIAVGEPQVRALLHEKVKRTGLRYATLVDPTAIISPTSRIGEGVIVSEFVTVHSNVTLQENCLIQPQAVLGHDIIVGAHAVVSAFCAPGGNVSIGQQAFLGMHCSVKEGLVIGDCAIVGMGSVVYSEVPSKAVVLGNPARVTRGSDEKKVFSSRTAC